MHRITERDGHYEITLTRGDTLILDITMESDGEPFEPTSGTVKFVMKPDYDAEATIEKTIPLETMELEIAPNDTKTLPIGERYVFDISYTDTAGNVDTFIEGVFRIAPEVG